MQNQNNTQALDLSVDPFAEDMSALDLSVDPFAEVAESPQGLQMENKPEVKREDKGILSDLGGLYGMGSGQLLSGAGWLFGSDAISKLGEDTTKYWEKTLSQAQADANEKRFVEDDWSAGEALADPRSWAGTIVQSLPAMVGGAGVAALTTRGALKLGASKGTAVGAGTVAGSTMEGATIAGMVGDETYKAVIAAPKEQLSQSPYYQDLIRAGVSPEEARESTAIKASEAAALPAGVGGAILGLAFNKFVGDAVTGSLSKRVGLESLKGAGIEGTTEILQGGLETGSKQYYLNELANQEYDLPGAANDLVAGGASGTAMGGAVGGLGGLASNQQTPIERDDTQSPDDIRQEPEVQAEPEQASQDGVDINDLVDENGNLREEFDGQEQPSYEQEAVQDFDLDAELATDPFAEEPVTQEPEQEAIPTAEPEQSTESNKTGIYRVPVDQIQVDPEQYQFRSKVNKEGVDSRLDGVEKWDDARSGVVTIHKRKDGSMFVADGHHRVDLAKKLKQPDLNARFLDEKDFTVEEARQEAAMQNIADGKAEAVDIAKVIKNSNKKVSDVRKEHNLPNSQLVRDGESLSKLNDNVFGMVVNSQINEKDGAAIGSTFEDSKQESAADIFQKVKPATEAQRQLLINEINAAEFAEAQGEQGGLFGDDPQEVSLMQDRLKVLDSLRTRLNTDKKLFNSLNKNADRAAQAGNKIAVDANSDISAQSQKSLELINRVATTPELNKLVNQATKRVADGESVATVSKELQKELMSYEQATTKQASEEPTPRQSSEQTDQAGQDNRGSEPVSSGNPDGADDQGKRGVREDATREQVTATEHKVDLVLNKGLIDKKATEAKLPSIEPGFVRLFRAESPTVKFDDVFDAKKLKQYDPEKLKGNFYTTEIEYADYFRETYGKDASIVYADIKESELIGREVAKGEYVVDLKQSAIQVSDKYAEGVDRVEHVTKKGKKLVGIVDKDITLDKAKEIDPYAFKKDGGVFIRDARIEEYNESNSLLSSYTEAELKEKADKQKAQDESEAQAKKAAEDKEKADLAVDDFDLTGSSLPADANPNQTDIFDSSEPMTTYDKKTSEPTTKSDQAKVKSDQAAGQVEDKKPKASANKVFTDDAAEKARAILKSKLGQLNSGFDPELLQAGITLAGYHIEKGARTFSAYARAMVDDMGESIKPFLKSWYMGVKYDPRAQEFEGMSSAESVEKMSIDDALNDNVGVEDAQYTAGSEKQDSAKNGKQNTSEDFFAEERGSSRQGADEVSQNTGENEQGSSNTLDDGRTSSDRKPSNKPIHNGKSRVGASPAASSDSIGSLPDSTGGLFAEQERNDDTERVIESTPTTHKKLSLKAPSKHVSGDISQIKERMPFLTDGQIEDVVTTEKRFSKPDGFGMMFTNGTGTGKTFTGLGVVRRFVDQGKKNILIVAPKQTIADAWMKAGTKFFDLEISRLEDINDKGKGIVVTTYANLGQNDALVTRDFDLVIADESHYLSSDQAGSATNALKKFQSLTLKAGTGLRRVYAQNSDLAAKMRSYRADYEASKGSDDPRVQAAGDQALDRAQEISKELDALARAENERIDALKPEEKPRAVFLSATPFAYDKNIIIGQDFLFDWGGDRGNSGSKSYNHADNFQDFMMTHFGYRMRYGKLTQPDSKVDSGLMERAFNSWLKKEGALAGRTLDSDFDYDRRFILAESAIGKRVDDAIAWLGGRDIENEPEERTELRRELEEIIIGNNFKYHARMYFLEAIKAKEALPNIKEYVEAGYKVLVMHDYKKGGTKNPFRIAPPSDLAGIYREFKAEFGDLIQAFSSLPSPIDLLTSEFPNALVYNGNVSAKNRIGLQDQFNSDESGAPSLMIAQGDAMREGVSIHDTTGKHQRVLIHLGMPVKPTAAIQQEGRIYRTGQASDAIFRYFTIGSNWERYTFASTISQRASTAENLAMGELARGLKESFIEAYEEAGEWAVGMPDEGKGGKARDIVLSNVLTPWDMAKNYYYGTKKQGSGRAAKGREGADYFATPEPLGMKMVQWADIRGGESVLEPSAGHGAIGRFFPENTTNKAIEQSDELASKLSLRFNGDVLTGDFEDHNIINKYDAIVMNPPYGSGGKTAADHVRKAIKHLRDGGRVVALVPTGPAADKQFDKLLYPADPKKDTDAKDVYVISDVTLPRVTFERAGTSVSTKVLVLEKQTDKDLVANIRQSNKDYSNAETIDEFFDRLETSEMPERVKPFEEVEEVADSAPEINKVEAGFETWEAEHTKTNDSLFMAKPSVKVEKDQFKKIAGVAKKHGGYWSRFGKAGFLFKTEQNRSDFVNALSDDAKFSLDKAGKSYDTVSTKDLDKLAEEFKHDYNGNIPLEFVIVKNQEEVYGPDNTAEKTGKRVGGAYHAKSRKVVLVASSFRDLSTARKTIKHEVIGHYGLNTFTAEDKKAFLRKILETRNEPFYKKAWSKIDDLYSDESDLGKAEEFFAFTVEKGDSVLQKFLDYMADSIRKMLKKVGLAKSVITRSEIREVAASIAKGIRSGSRTQQNFPKDDSSQFSRTPREPETEAQSRVKKFFDGIAHQPIDRMFRVPFDALNMLDSHGRLKGGVKLHKKAEYAIKEWRPHSDGKFKWMDNVLETARHGLIDRYKLSDEYKSKFREAEALGRGIDNQALDILKTLEERGIDAAEAVILQKMLTGEPIEDHHLNAVSEPILRAVDDLGLMAVEYGVITREQFERNRGSYLHRSYTKHEGEFTGLGKWLLDKQSNHQKRKIQGKSAKGRGIERKLDMSRLLKHVPQDWFGIKNIPKKPDLNALNGLKFKVLENPGVDPTHSDTFEGMDTPEHTASVETIYWPEGMPLPAKYEGYRNKGTFEVRGKRKGKVVLWRDYTKAERANMGEILDARYNIAKTFTVISRDIAMGKFFQDVSQNDTWFQRDLPHNEKVLTPNEARSLRNLSKTDWVEVPDTTVAKSAGTKQWGALAGGYVRAEIWRDLTELDKMHNPGTWRKILTQWKLNKTARSPVVHMNNVVSNMMFMDLADVRMTDLVSGIKSYVKNDEHRKEAETNGAFEGTFANEELRRKVMEPILNDLMNQNIDTSHDLSEKSANLWKLTNTLYKSWQKFDDKMVGFYQVEDEVFRMATYMRRISLGDSPKEAARIAKEQFLDYDIRAPWVNAARRSVLPFISYTYRAIPVLAQAISERPWKVAKYATIAYAAEALAYAMVDGDEEEERASLRDDQQGGTWLGVPRMARMPWNDDYDNPVFLDIRRWIPAGDVFDLAQGKGAVPLPTWLQLSGPLLLGFEVAAFNIQNFTGKEITSITDTALEASSKTFDYVYKSWMPSAAYIPGSYYFDKVVTAADGGRDILGRPYSVPQALLSSLGIKVQPHDVQLGFAFKERDLAAQARMIGSEVRTAEQDYQRKMTSKAELNKIKASAKKKLIALNKISRELNSAKDR